jgi:hypothetical protein
MSVVKEEYRDLPPRGERLCDVVVLAQAWKKSNPYTRVELRYILDPADVMGPDYPSESFHVLKEGQRCAYDYWSRRLVLEAWDAQERGG